MTLLYQGIKNAFRGGGNWCRYKWSRGRSVHRHFVAKCSRLADHGNDVAIVSGYLTPAGCIRIFRPRNAETDANHTPVKPRTCTPATNRRRWLRLEKTTFSSR